MEREREAGRVSRRERERERERRERERRETESRSEVERGNERGGYGGRMRKTLQLSERGAKGQYQNSDVK